MVLTKILRAKRRQPPSKPSWLHLAGHEHDVLLDVAVVPRSSHSRVVCIHEGRLKIQLAATPADGRANQALVRLVAGLLQVSRAQVMVVGGATNCNKTVRVMGLVPQRVVLALSPPQGH